MRGFIHNPAPIYPKTGFTSFRCQECGAKVVISGKIIHHNPLRWVTRGVCRIDGCKSQHDMITTRVEHISEKKYGGQFN